MYTVTVKGKIYRYPSLELLKKIHGENAAYQSFPKEKLVEVSKKRHGAKLYAHNGTAILADTDEHAAAIETLKEIDGIQRQLEAIDRKHGPRTSRELALTAARKSKVSENDGDLKRLREAKEQSDALRGRMESLKKSMEAI